MRPASVAKATPASKQVGDVLKSTWKSAGSIFINGLDTVGTMLEGQGSPSTSPFPSAKAGRSSSVDASSLWEKEASDTEGRMRSKTSDGIKVEIPSEGLLLLEKEETSPIESIKEMAGERETGCGVAIPLRESSLKQEAEEASHSSFDVQLSSTELEIILECCFGAIEEVYRLVINTRRLI
jgi:hypothetical protein